MSRHRSPHEHRAFVAGLIGGVASGFGWLCIMAVSGQLRLFSSSSTILLSLVRCAIAAGVGAGFAWSATYLLDRRRARAPILIQATEELDALIDLRDRGLITGSQFEERRDEMRRGR